MCFIGKPEPPPDTDAMEFGETHPRDALGSVLAHTIHLGDGVIKKGRVLEAEDIARLTAAGYHSITVARLGRGDLAENEAAKMVAAGLASRGLEASDATTGRANLRARASGLLLVNPYRVHQLNRIHEAVTLATAAPWAALERSKIAATVKIITFGVPERTVRNWLDIARRYPPAVRLKPFRPRKVALVQTSVPGQKEAVLDKARRTTEARLEPLGSTLAEERRCAHAAADIAAHLVELAEGGCDIALVLGASAIADRLDVVPKAVALAGGRIEHLGMPVDPGHLTLLAGLGSMSVLGLPGSARSPRPHGFDRILQRLAAGVRVRPDDIARMGVGGLLKEVPGRPMPRDPGLLHRGSERRIAGVILAAGQSRRMGRVNKMLVEIDGEPMIVHAARAMLASRAGPVIVVLGHEPDAVRHALRGMDVRFVHNPGFASGLSTSLRAGLEALPAEAAGAVVALGDMPRVAAADIDALIDAFEPDEGATICVPTHDGKRGNPVLWARRYFLEMAAVSGDVGARSLIGENADQVLEVPRGNPGVLLDLDTPDALRAHAGREGGS